MGKALIVGAGPGDPELLTIKALRALQQADVIIYDRLVSPEVLALGNPRAERIYAGKHEGEQERVQASIMQLLLEHARQAKTVVRLKGGDPMVFGRGAEEWAFLNEHGIDVEIVPGISSAVSAPAVAGIPLTFRGVATSFAVITGHCRDGINAAWEKYAGVDTLVVLMGVKNRDCIASRLIEAGRAPDTPAAFIEHGTTPRENVIVTTLGEIARGAVDVEAPAVFVIGEVVAIRARLTEVAQAALAAA
jgi:uroporphyrin-III C-methyltransferase